MRVSVIRKYRSTCQALYFQLSQYKVSSCHAASSFAGVGGVHGEARMDIRIAILS